MWFTWSNKFYNYLGQCGPHKVNAQLRKHPRSKGFHPPRNLPVTYQKDYQFFFQKIISTNLRINTSHFVIRCRRVYSIFQRFQ